MTVEQFNFAVKQYCNKINCIDLEERFIATIGGKNILYTKTTGEEKENFELASTLDITPTGGGYLFAAVSDIPSQFEKDSWQKPTLFKQPAGEISPEKVKEFRGYSGGSILLYNENFIAYCIKEPNGKFEEGFLIKENGTWGGFGESRRQEFVNWLIKTGYVPV